MLAQEVTSSRRLWGQTPSATLHELGLREAAELCFLSSIICLTREAGALSLSSDGPSAHTAHHPLLFPLAEKGLDIALIVGICGGGIFFLLFVALLILFISKRRRQHRREHGEPPASAPLPAPQAWAKSPWKRRVGRTLAPGSGSFRTPGL